MSHLDRFKTRVEFLDFMHDADKSARYAARDFMQHGKSKWIAKARLEGWPEVLKSLAYQLARRDLMQYGNLPSLSRLDGLVINDADHKSFKAMGRS